MKSKYSKCTDCKLLLQEIVKPESNCKNNLSSTKILILAEAPSHEEIKQKKPLVGPAGEIFRSAFEKSRLNTLPYVISNVVLCANIKDNKTFNPPDDAVESCKPNWNKLIEVSNPDLILVMGTIPMKALGIGDSGITKKRGNFYNYKNKKVLVTIHPSYVKRRGGIGGEEYGLFLRDLEMAYNFLKGRQNIDTEKDKVKEKNKVKELKHHTIELPKWCYSEDVCLFDIQNSKRTNEIIYIFKNKKNEKIYHREKESNNYFYINKNTDIKNAPMIEKTENLDLIINEEPSAYSDYAIYESDLRTELRHAIDYRMSRSKPECDIKLDTLMFDIEVYNYGSKDFPDPKEANAPVSAISFKLNDEPLHIYLTKHKKSSDTKIKPIKNVKIKTFSSEKNLIEGFMDLIQKSKIDLICGWNSNGFDIPTLYNRARKNGIDTNLFSPLKIVDINPYRFGVCDIFGLFSLDLCELYKSLTQNREESYKLDYISNKHLKTGKVSYDGSLDELYENDINKFISYSVTDTKLLYDLNNELGHINMIWEIIVICSSTWKSSRTTTGQIDPLCVSYANKNNLVCRNSLHEKTSETIPGAYVRIPKAGLHGNLIDLDFTSLYPSIIRTCNIGPNTYIARIKQTEKNKLFLNKEKKVFFNKTAFQYIYDQDNLPEKIELELQPLYKDMKTVTVTKKQFEEFIEKIQGIVTITGCIYKGHDKESSFFNNILTYLMSSRSEYKNKRKQAENSNEKILEGKYDNIQWAYKILANSLYGVLANYSFRFFNHDMAKTITLTGQEVVKFSGFHLGQYLEKEDKSINNEFLNDYDTSDVPYLVYQDTDSLFVQLGDYILDKRK